MKRGTGMGHARRINLLRLQKEIKPCPFDGKMPELWGVNFPYARRWLRCQCGAMSPRRSTAEDAVAWWNRRAA